MFRLRSTGSLLARLPRATVSKQLAVLPRTFGTATNHSSTRALGSLKTGLTSQPAFALPSVTKFAMRSYATEASKNLADTLKQEKKFEVENPLDEAFIKEYLSKSPFKLHDSPRKMEVEMKRRFNNEDISIFFTVESRPSDAYLDDEEFEDGDNSAQNRGSHKSNEDVAEDEEVYPPSAPTLFSVLVSKGSAGTLTFNCFIQDGQIQISQVIFNGDSKMALADTADADYNRTNVYPGPNIEDLDEGLQDQLYDYLLERLGDEGELSAFIPTYIEYKEQAEYVNWLEDLEKFLHADK